MLNGRRRSCSANTQRTLPVGVSDPSRARGYISAATPAEIVKHALPLVAGVGVFAPPFLYGGISDLALTSGPSAAGPAHRTAGREILRSHEVHDYAGGPT